MAVTPEQIKAAVPAMRRWLINRVPNERRSAWAGMSDGLVRDYVDALYKPPGGVAQFLADHPEAADVR